MIVYYKWFIIKTLKNLPFRNHFNDMFHLNQEICEILLNTWCQALLTEHELNANIANANDAIIFCTIHIAAIQRIVNILLSRIWMKISITSRQIRFPKKNSRQDKFHANHRGRIRTVLTLLSLISRRHKRKLGILDGLRIGSAYYKCADLLWHQQLAHYVSYRILRVDLMRIHTWKPTFLICT